MTIIKTSSWFAKLPDGHCRIGISRGAPRGMSDYRRYPKLNPGPWFNSVSPVEYKKRYHEEILSRLDAAQVVRELADIANGGVPVLVCFEGAADKHGWCHRGLVAGWLHDELQLEVREIGREDCGCGWRHPKLDPMQWNKPTPVAVPDRSADIAPYVGKVFRREKIVYQVRGQHPEFPDQVVVWDGKKEQPIHVDLMLKYMK